MKLFMNSGFRVELCKNAENGIIIPKTEKSLGGFWAHLIVKKRLETSKTAYWNFSVK